MVLLLANKNHWSFELDKVQGYYDKYHFYSYFVIEIHTFAVLEKLNSFIENQSI